MRDGTKLIFNEAERIYENASVTPFDQSALLEEGESGFCLALSYKWAESFYKTPEVENHSLWLPAYRNQFWHKLNDPTFIATLKAEQNRFSFPDAAYLSFFRSRARKIAMNYGFKQHPAELSARYQISSPEINEIIHDLVAKGRAQIFYLLKDYHSDGNGHAVAMAAKMNELGHLRIGFFDPNYGEVLFDYHVNQLADLERKVEWVISEINDCWMPVQTQTFKDFVSRVFSEYASQGRYRYFKYFSMEHTNQERYLQDQNIQANSEAISHALTQQGCMFA